MDDFLPKWTFRWMRHSGRGYCVLFVFPDFPETRLIQRIPTRGMRVQSSLGRSWIVVDVYPTGRDHYTAFCASRHIYAKEVGPSLAADVRDLSADLIERARRSAAKRRSRHYIP
jgi:hypothetical protein